MMRAVFFLYRVRYHPSDQIPIALVYESMNMGMISSRFVEGWIGVCADETVVAEMGRGLLSGRYYRHDLRTESNEWFSAS